jgi:hypothetical protein
MRRSFDLQLGKKTPRGCKLPPMRQLHVMRHAGIVHMPTALAFGNFLAQIRQPNIGSIAFGRGSRLRYQRVNHGGLLGSCGGF